MTATALQDAITAAGLALRATCPLDASDGFGEADTVLLLGPDEPGFWPLFTASPEAQDGQQNPMDRWSKRVIGAVAEAFGATAVFPSDGPPYPPFIGWALRSEHIWEAPVGLLVQSDTGLFLSFRGALLVRADQTPDLAPATSPCLTCAEKPCLTACPVGAMGLGQAYDVPRCQAHVRSPEGQSCKQAGCLVRRACPVSRGLNRRDAQSAFHMRAFLGE